MYHADIYAAVDTKGVILLLLDLYLLLCVCVRACVCLGKGL